MSTAAIVGGSIAAAGIGAGSSISAANTQADAANKATETQAQEAQNALDYQKQVDAQNRANQAPWLNAGQSAVSTLSGLIPQMNAANANYPAFQAPTADQARQTPGYQFAMQQGLQGVQNSAAARGDLLSGNTLAATEKYGQGLADSNYQQTYNNALGQYQQAYNQFQNQQNGEFNRYAALAGYGQTAANQLSAQGQQSAQNAGNISINLGQQVGNNLQNAAAATASGYVGAGNAINSSIGNIGQYLSLSQLLKGNSGSNPYGDLLTPTS